jgi:hypothetical protein
MRERTIWIFAGLLGLAVAVALAVLTSHVSQPRVGLSGEPVSAGRQLAPARTPTSSGAPARELPARPATSTPTTAAPPPPAAEAPPRSDDDAANDSSGSGSDDDSSGGSRGRGRGRGRGGGDD